MEDEMTPPKGIKIVELRDTIRVNRGLIEELLKTGFLECESSAYLTKMVIICTDFKTEVKK